MYQHFGWFSLVGRFIYLCMGQSFAVLMGLVVVETGLRRSAEAGF